MRILFEICHRFKGESFAEILYLPFPTGNRGIRSFCLQDFPLRRIGFPNRPAEKHLPQ